MFLTRYRINFLFYQYGKLFPNMVAATWRHLFFSKFFRIFLYMTTYNDNFKNPDFILFETTLFSWIAFMMVLKLKVNVNLLTKCSFQGQHFALIHFAYMFIEIGAPFSDAPNTWQIKG